MRLDEDKLEELRRWGQGLRQAGSEESAAAGRAILMLIEEVDRLRLELVRARDQLGPADVVPSVASAENPAEPVESTLHGRLQRVLKRDIERSPESRPDPAEEAESNSANDETSISPQSWIESLRRQK
jgi:hypothetical protein